MQRIPVDDLPQSWGAREEFLAQIRRERLEARRRARSMDRFYAALFVFVVAFSLANEWNLLERFWTFLNI